MIVPSNYWLAAGVSMLSGQTMASYRGCYTSTLRKALDTVPFMRGPSRRSVLPGTDVPWKPCWGVTLLAPDSSTPTSDVDGCTATLLLPLNSDC